MRRRHMKQRSIREHAIKSAIWKIECKEVLQPYFASGFSTRHLDKANSAFETYRHMATRDKRFQVTPRAATEVEDSERRFALDVTQQCVDVLTDIVIASAFAKALGVLVVVSQCLRRNRFQIG